MYRSETKLSMNLFYDPVSATTTDLYRPRHPLARDWLKTFHEVAGSAVGV